MIKKSSDRNVNVSEYLWAGVGATMLSEPRFSVHEPILYTATLRFWINYKKGGAAKAQDHLFQRFLLSHKLKKCFQKNTKVHTFFSTRNSYQTYQLEFWKRAISSPILCRKFHRAGSDREISCRLIKFLLWLECWYTQEKLQWI